MKTLFNARWLLAVCYAGMMALYRLKEFRQWLQVLRVVAFLLAWGCVAAVGAPVWKVISLFGDILERPDVAALFEIFGILVLSSVVVKVLIDHPEWHDYAHIGPFLRHSLMFHNPALVSVNLFEEAEKEEIRQIYFQQTGRSLNLPNALDEAAGTIHPGRPVTPAKRSAPVQGQFSEHRKKLDAGELVDLTEAYKLFIFRTWKEQEPDQVFRMAVDPAKRILSADLLMKEFHSRDRSNPDKLFRFKQDVYEELQRINQLPLLKPYAGYYDRIELQGHRPDEDGFGNPIEVPWFTIRMNAAELRNREGKMFIATELDRIATIEWMEAPS